MVHHFPPPDYRSLLPPLLACLPTAFVSPRPPPALLPLLTPILRQRVQLLATTASSPSDSWLPLLCWETDPAQRLVDLVSDSDAFELHPVSGEIDIGDVEDLRYRRLDEETLQSRIVVRDLGLVIVYLWCEEDQEGGANGWRVSEVRPLEGEGDDTTDSWSPSIGQADEKSQQKMMDDALQQGENYSVAQEASNGHLAIPEEKEDDDDYWAQYDSTPGRTPATISPNPPPTMNRHTRTTSEAEYYAQYAQIQPDMDNDDPSEDPKTFGDSSLNANVMASSMVDPTQSERALHQHMDAVPNGFDPEPPNLDISQPAASLPRTRSSTVSKLEESAESQSMGDTAVRQHVSTSIKSLFRLARGSGIERSDFDRMVRTELDTLCMVAEDD